MNPISLTDAWSGIADCRNCTLRTIALFAGLTESDFGQIHTPIGQKIFPADAAIYHTGGKGDEMFTIRKGLVKLVTYLPDGTQRIVRLLRSSDVAGLETIIGNDYQHDAIALTPTEVCRLPAQLVRDLAKSNPRLHDELMRRWQMALSQADIWLAEFSTGPARQRVARLLLRLCNAGTNIIELFGREDLGAVLGVTTETASRTIADFRRKGLIREVAPNRFECNPQELDKLLNLL